MILICCEEGVEAVEMVFARAGIVELLYFSWEVWRVFWAYGELHAVDGLVKDPREALSYREEMGTDSYRRGFEMHSVGVRDMNTITKYTNQHTQSPIHKVPTPTCSNLH